MRILQILPELNVGGVETGTVDFAKYLIDHRHHAVVVSNGGTLVKQLEQCGAKHYRLPVHKKSMICAYRCIKQLSQIIADERIDIIHARSRVPGWIAYFSTRKTKTAFINTCHGYYGKHFFSRVMGFSKLVIVPSQVIGRHMIDDFRVKPQAIRVIPRSVDLKKFNKPPEGARGATSIIAIVGRITPLKGHGYFLKAMAKVIRSLPYVKIWIIGDAPANKAAYKEELQLLVKRLGLTDHVEFLGNRRDVPELLAQCHVLVLSTITQEAFGRVVLEAQAAGVPVVATRVGGVAEIIEDGKTGLLVMPKDIDAMALEVIRVLKDKKLVEQLTSAAKNKLKEKYTLEHMASATLNVYDELLRLENILVIKLSSIGDVILVTASLKALRKKFPQAKIHCVVGLESRKILQRCPYIDELIIYDHKGKDHGPLGLLRIAGKLRRIGFDKIIDFQNNSKSHLLSFFAFPRDSYGYNNGKMGFLLTNKIKNTKKKIPPVAHQFQVLKMLGVNQDQHQRLELWPSVNDERAAQELLDVEWLGDCKKIVGINLAASQKWITKNWPLEHIAHLCDILAFENIRVVLTGLPKDKPASLELFKLTKSKPANLIGKTDILQLAALIKRCKVFITPDSAPMHVAAAVGVPFIAFFGPTDPERHLPPAAKFTVFKRDLHCAPCYSSRCRILTHACMKEITPQEVAKEVKILMGASR